MVKRRVIVSYFSDASKLKAQSKIENANVTSSFIVGDMEEQDISVLEREKGLIVEIMQSKNPVVTPGKARVFSKGEGTDDIFLMERSSTVDEGKPNFYVLELNGPLLKEWKQEIQNLGINLLSSIPYNNYLAKMTPDQTKGVKRLDFVKNVSLYDKSDTRLAKDGAFAMPSQTERTVAGESLKYHAILHDKNDLEKTVGWLKSNDVHVNASQKDVISFTIKSDPALLEKIRMMPEVSEIQQDLPPEEYNYIARVLLHVDSNSPGGIASQNFSDGDGQVIGVVDSGIDKDHQDFQGRVIDAIREVSDFRPGDTRDYSGHGTHVAGSILGDGAKSNAKIRGVIPKAKLFFQSVGGEGNKIITPTNENDFFEFCDRAYSAGVKTSNHSWGSAGRSLYYISSRLFDRYALEHPDFLFVVAAGNDAEAITKGNGQIGDPLHSKRGYVDWFSVGSPGTCKNGLTVGATRSTRQDGPNKDAKWGQREKVDPATGQRYNPFPNPPIADEKVCGDPDSMAAFSGRGPVEPRRIKPDVVAPGTDILSTRSSLDPKTNFHDTSYVYKSGTSMATPLVSGCAALVRDYYLKRRNHNPSASLVKATLINGSRWLGGPDSLADHATIPNYHQGFGMVDLTNTIPNNQSPNLKLEFVDTWVYGDNSRKIMRTGSRKIYRVKTSNASFLRVCMTYNDRPSVGLENNLNLFTRHVETDDLRRGNEQVRTDINIPDPDNNVEVIRLENPQDGTYEIHVVGKNLVDENIDFSLAVTGDNISSLVETE